MTLPSPWRAHDGSYTVPVLPLVPATTTFSEAPVAPGLSSRFGVAAGTNRGARAFCVRHP